MIILRILTCALLAGLTITLSGVAGAAECRRSCDGPVVNTGAGELTASYLSELTGSIRIASNREFALQPYVWRLRTNCQQGDATQGACAPIATVCPTTPGRLIQLYLIQHRPLVQASGLGPNGEAPPPGVAIGAAFGNWANEGFSCVDVTDLNPPPSPDEVFRYFRTLPLPQLTTQQQPPGNALVGLPVIFFTDSPTTQTFTVDIRGFAVVITAHAAGFTWHTGDGATVTSTDPGAPYPDQTVTHDYASGTYTAYVTTTWAATYSVDGGAQADVPGTTTTDGPPITFTVLQAHTVLTNPYD
jgi:hypothetical protein